MELTSVLLLIGLLGLLLAAAYMVFGLGLLSRPRTIRHFEAEEYGRVHPFVEPDSVVDGLAVYSVGSGKPVLLFPYPHGQTTKPMAQSLIAEQLVGLGRKVLTFDVPGAFRSTRDAAGDMDEMIESAAETLDRMGIGEPVDVVGHSMGGFAALGFAIERPEQAGRLVLIGSMSGFPAVFSEGLPGSKWRVFDPIYWKFLVLGIQNSSGRGNLASHKKLRNLMAGVSYYDKRLFTPLEIDDDDAQKGVPLRAVLWGKNMWRRLSYAGRLGKVKAPTLIMAGRHDPTAPVACSEELFEGIPDAELLVFERSGHYPYEEEESRFTGELAAFLNRADYSITEEFSLGISLHQA